MLGEGRAVPPVYSRASEGTPSFTQLALLAKKYFYYEHLKIERSQHKKRLVEIKERIIDLEEIINVPLKKILNDQIKRRSA